MDVFNARNCVVLATIQVPGLRNGSIYGIDLVFQQLDRIRIDPEN
jgi:hypothetical protein